jgi:hypothetical protein
VKARRVAWLNSSDVQLAEAHESEKNQEAIQPRQDFVAVGSVKPASATIYLLVISVPKAKKKAKKKK